MPSIAAFPDLLDLSAAAAGQIKFPATQHVSADPNTLDDYKEGTFTPAITFGGGAVGLTYSTRTGTYSKEIFRGRICWKSLIAAELRGRSKTIAVLTLS